MSKTTNYNFDKQKWGHQIREDDLNRIAVNLDLIDAAIASRPSAATLVVAASDSLHKERADYVCPGVDDQVVIQAAIDALSSGSGKVVLLDGIYTVSGISVPDNVTLQGQGFSTKLYLVDGGTGPVITNSDHSGGNTGIIIKDLFVDGNAANAVTYSRGIEFRNVNKSIITRCWGQKGKEGPDSAQRGVGIYVAAESTDVKVSECFATQNGHEGIGIRNGCKRISIIGCSSWGNTVEGFQIASETVAVDSCTDILVMGNVAQSPASYAAITVHPGPADSYKRINIVNNIIYDSGGGVNIYDDDVCRIVNLIVSGNTIFNIGTHGRGIETRASDRVIISNNQIIDAQIGAIKTLGDNININNNIIKNSGAYGISVWGEYSTISGNVLTGGASGGIFTAVGCSYVLINGNVISSNIGTGMFLEGDHLWLSNNQIIDNNTDNGLHGGITVDASYSTIIGNKIYLSNPAVGHVDGLYLLGNADNCVVKDNDIRDGGVTLNVKIDGGVANLIIQNNLGYITKNSDTSTGTGAQQTIAHGLAATPTKVILWNIEDGANPYQSAVADGTNIKITAVINQDYGWEAEVV